MVYLTTKEFIRIAMMGACLAGLILSIIDRHIDTAIWIVSCALWSNLALNK